MYQGNTRLSGFHSRLRQARTLPAVVPLQPGLVVFFPFLANRSLAYLPESASFAKSSLAPIGVAAPKGTLPAAMEVAKRTEPRKAGGAKQFFPVAGL